MLHGRLFLCSFLTQTIYTLLERSLLKWKFLRFWSARLKFCQIPYTNFETTTHFLSKLCISLMLHGRLFLCSFLTQTIYTLLERSLLKWKFLRFWSARVKFCQIPLCQFWKDKLLPLQFFLSFFSFIKDYSSVLFLAQTIYTLLKRSPLKLKFLRFWSSLVKFCQIHYANFERTSRFLPNFCIFLQFHKRLFLCNFFSSNNIYFAQKDPDKMKIFEILDCSGQILSNSLFQFWNDKSLPLQFFCFSSVS